MIKMLTVYATALVLSTSAWAQEVVATLPVLDQIAEKIPHDGAAVTAMALIVGFALDMIIRLKKTTKPLDLLILVGRGLRGVGNIFLKLSNLMDKILPQRSDEPKEEKKLV